MPDTIERATSEIASPEELVRRAQALVPMIRDAQEETEASGRVSPEIFGAIRDQEIFKILLPKRYGGFEYGLDTFAEVGFEIARGCGSVGWVNSVTAMYHVFLGMYPEQAQDDVWGEDAGAVVAASFTPTGTVTAVKGGYSLTGKWMFCSGIDNCAWTIVGVTIPATSDDEPEGKAYALVRTSEFEMENNWNVVGLSGTGSKNIQCDDLFVPEHRFLPIEDTMSGKPPGAAVNDGPLYRIPLFAAMSCSLVAPIMGMAQGAIDEFIERTKGRTTRGAALSKPAPMAALPGIQLKLGEAMAAVDAARLLVDRDLKDIMETVSSGRELTIDQRARNKGDWGYAARLSVQAVDAIFAAGGGGALFKTARIQRYWRDTHAGSAHISMNWDAVGALYGRVTLGLPSGPAQF
ncbi:MAG: acyl-CoA dehydrogenase family protein [Alphaproteobacteria bacterium]|jgi:alkylation response protein AidB-like acyl-CoA dehydrogenase|nr:acyl-CoA dehydrogenase family protein [Alphaproteobacteria bacterium]